MKSWTTFEEAYLLDNYETEGVKACAEALNRNTNSIVNKARRMGLNIPNPHARRTRSASEYEDALSQNNILYFPKESYVNARTPIIHECIYGHEWKVLPSRILNKTAKCPKCAAINFNPYKPCILYSVSLIYKGTKYYILGLTTKEPKDKYLKDWNTFSMELEWYSLYSSGLDAYNIQQQILKTTNIVELPLSTDNSIISDAPFNKPGE